MNPFDGPNSKVGRARQHIAELEHEITAYLSREPWALLVERDKASGKCLLALRGRENIPSSISLAFGDAVHNLRAALDLLANVLVALSGVRPKKVYFPFAASAADLEYQIESKMKGANAEVRQMVRTLAPYRGGNETLRALHDLDIRDKHVSLIRAVAAGYTGVLPMRKQEGPRESGGWRIALTAAFDQMPVQLIDTSGFIFETPRRTEVLGKAMGSNVSLEIAKGLPLEGQPPIQALNGVADMVHAVVSNFERHFRQRSGFRSSGASEETSASP